MAKWKIINSRTAKDLGIQEVSADNDGYIRIDLCELPMGLTLKDVIAFAEKEGIIIADSKRGQEN